jgi:hypothetical protein
MPSVNLIGDCHATRIWEHWDPKTCPVDFKVWGLAGMTAWAFDPKKFEEEGTVSSGIEIGNQYFPKPRDYWERPFGEFKNTDIVLVWLGYVDIRQWLPKHKNTEQTVIEYLDRVTEYFKGSFIQLIEPLPQFTEMLLKYEDISPSYTYQERQDINGIFVKTLNDYARDHKMLTPISQEEIKEAVGLSEFTPKDTATWAPHPQDSLKREYWAKIYELFIKKIVLFKDERMDQWEKDFGPSEIFKNVKVQFSLISPPGSGNTFAENLLHEYVEDSWYESQHHDYTSFNKNIFDVSIIRDPYESIASCIELDLSKNSSSLNYLENARFMNQIKFDRSVLDYMFERCIEDYRYFLNQLNKEESSHALLCTFEFLTKTPENFLNNFSNKFNAKLKDFDSNLIQEIIINKMKNDKFAEKRIPKKMNPLRSLINNRIREYEPMKELFLEYKKQIEKENINE